MGTKSGIISGFNAIHVRSMLVEPVFKCSTGISECSTKLNSFGGRKKKKFTVHQVKLNHDKMGLDEKK